MYHVLIVDDEPYIRQGLRIIIPWEEYGFSIMGEAANGEEAIHFINEYNYHLIITDIKMPKVTGLELMEYTWRNISTQIPCILLSGYYDFEYAKKAIQCEAANYLLKPVDRQELVETIIKVKNQLEKQNIKVDKKIEQYHMEKEMLDSIIRDIEEQDYEGLEKKVEELHYLFKYKIRDKDLIQMHIDYLIMNLVDLIKKISKEINNEEIKELLSSSSLHSIPQNESIGALKRFVAEMTDYIRDIRRKTFNGVLTEIQKEIEHHYKDGLSLKNLSEKYYMNSAYLGQIFKKEYKTSFKDYLNSYRIEKAVELIKRTDMSIADIGQQVGFNTTDYFISKFVEVYKLTPLQYRKQIMSLKNKI